MSTLALSLKLSAINALMAVRQIVDSFLLSESSDELITESGDYITLE